jgi:hypothetical protein
MPRAFAGFLLPLLAALALLPPGKAVAGPPDGASGRIVFDEVGAGLDRYRKEKDPEKRAKWLEKLAPIRDPRVAVALGEALGNWNEKVRWAALSLILKYYCPPPRELEMFSTAALPRKADDWWKANEADLRRRAAQLLR